MTLRERIIELARAELGQAGPEPWAAEAGFRLGPNDKPSWCGLFVHAIWRRAGLRVPDWQMGKGNVEFLRRMAPGELIQPGDLGYLDVDPISKKPNRHHAIVIHDDGVTIRSVDGNAKDGRVTERLRPKRDYTAFYSVEPLLAAVRDAPTDPAPKSPTVLQVSPVQGAHVEALQRALGAHGYPLKVDGVAGKKTVQALVEYAIERLSAS